jgi:hypothetical protein
MTEIASRRYTWSIIRKNYEDLFWSLFWNLNLIEILT